MNKEKILHRCPWVDPAKPDYVDYALSVDLRRRGFKFVGSTICYAHMQATGMVDDHSVDCYRKNRAKPKP